MEYQLVLISGRRRGTALPITPEGVVLGRDGTADLFVADPTVSRRHCRIVRDGDRTLLEDLNSRNPTLLNGIPVRSGELALGDEIAIGSWRFLVTAASGEDRVLATASTGLDTLSWSHAQEIVLDADSALPPADCRPRTVQDLAYLHELGRELSGAEALQHLVELLWKRLEARFQPASGWVGRVDLSNSISFFESATHSAEEAPLDVIEKAIQEGRGVLVPGSVRRDGRRILLCTMVAPVRLAGMNLAVIALRTEAPRGAYDEEDLRLLVLVAQTVAPFISALDGLDQLHRDYERLRVRSGESLALVGASRTIRHVRAEISRASRSGMNVLITGESGTGKELAARLLHAQSPRHSAPFVIVNCAAIPRELFESEFFGYEKGAFTGALERSPGLLALAHGGTLFLDEIGNLSLENQARILRAIELGTFRRIGSREESQVDVRFVAATNADLAECIERGEFRVDLYHRLNGLCVHLPPLRERPSDIPILASYFFELSKAQAPRPMQGIAPEAMEYLSRQRWPGNVRELRNVILRGIATSHTETLALEDVRGQRGEDLAPGPAERLLCLEEAEKRHIEHILRHCSYNISQAAEILKVSRSTLYRKISEYRIPL